MQRDVIDIQCIPLCNIHCQHSLWTLLPVQGPDILYTKNYLPFLPVVSGVDCYTDVRHTVCQYWTAVKPSWPAGENFFTGHMHRLVTFIAGVS